MQLNPESSWESKTDEVFEMGNEHRQSCSTKHLQKERYHPVHKSNINRLGRNFLYKQAILDCLLWYFMHFLWISGAPQNQVVYEWIAGLLLFGLVSVIVHPKRRREGTLQASLLEDPLSSHPLSPKFCICCFRIIQNLTHNATTHSSIIMVPGKTSKNIFHWTTSRGPQFPLLT